MIFHRFVQDNRVQEKIEAYVTDIANTITTGAAARQKEWHERLKRNVAKLTCDLALHRTPLEIDAYTESLDKQQLRQLVAIYWNEMQQVIQAINDAK
jgi:hypothetical protein